MDIERAIEFLLAQQAQSDARHAQSQADFEARMSAFNTNMDLRLAQITDKQLKAEVEIAQIRAQISRGVRLAVEEARRERRQRQEEDAKLAALHAETERSLQQLIASLNQP